MSRCRRINYDDDLVIVKKGKEVIYRGLEDYEPLKDEPWRWDEKAKCYKLNGLKKYCLNA